MPVQARITPEAYQELAERAEKETRSVSNFLERMIYQHLGIVK